MIFYGDFLPFFIQKIEMLIQINMCYRFFYTLSFFFLGGGGWTVAQN